MSDDWTIEEDEEFPRRRWIKENYTKEERKLITRALFNELMRMGQGSPDMIVLAKIADEIKLGIEEE